MTSNGEWDGVTERRQGERRKRGPPQHVELDSVSNGARTLLERAILTGENAVDEAKKTRRWIVGALLIVGAFVFAAGEFRGETRAAIDRRPTSGVVRAMFDSAAVLREARDSAVIARLYEQGSILERLAERQQVLIDSYEEHDAVIQRLQEEELRRRP